MTEAASAAPAGAAAPTPAARASRGCAGAIVVGRAAAGRSASTRRTSPSRLGRQRRAGARGAARARAGGPGHLPAAPRLLRHRAARRRPRARSTSCARCSRSAPRAGRCRRSTTRRSSASREAARDVRRRGRGAATSPPSWRPTAASTSRSSTRPDQPHTMRLIRLLWDSTEAYRALYYNSPERARARRSTRTTASSPPSRARDADALVAELDAHRDRALSVLDEVLRPREPPPS